MQFNIDEDRGDYISGWILPDNPSLEPRVIARADGREAIVPPTLVHSNMSEQGLHETGLCGFEVREEALPGLAGARSVQLYEEDTGLLIYNRRGPHAYVEAKLFTFDCRNSENSLVAPAFSRAFHMAYPDVNLIGPETRKCCIDVRFTTSLYVGGPVQYRAIEPFLRNKGFRLTALLADPTEILFASLLPPATAAEPDAPRRLSQAIQRLTKAQHAMLNDQLTRRLSLLYFEDSLERDAVAQALDVLSDFDAVGIESSLPDFMALTAAVCETEERIFGHAAYRPPLQLATALRRESAVQDLIGRDIEIYDAVADAILATQTAR